VVTSNAYTPGALQSNLMAKMPAFVRAITFPFGRSATQAAEALADLAVADRHGTTTAQFYKRDRPLRPPNAALDTAAQLRLRERCTHLLGIEPIPGRGADR
jgi:hypothetical protein